MGDLARTAIDDRLFLTGCFTTASDGRGAGIGVVGFDKAGALNRSGVAAEPDIAPSPSFIARHPTQRVVYAIGAADESLRVFRPTSTGIRLELASSHETGKGPCHVAVSPREDFLIVCCYGDGQVILFELDEVGAIIRRVPAASAVDPYGGAERQSRAHQSLVLGDGTILTTDLGLDLVRVWSYERTVGLTLRHELTLPKGAGPRHLAQHQSGCVYVLTEYSIEIFILVPDRLTGRLELVGHTPATLRGARPGDAGAEISVTDSGSHVHATVRSSNRICTLSVSENGSRLTPQADTDCGGVWPRHHLQSGSELYVANQGSNSIATFRLDPKTAIPAELVGTVTVGSPSCIVPIESDFFA